MSCSSPRRTSSRCSSGSSCCRSRSTCCARPRCAARRSLESGPEVPDHRLGRLGDAALRPGASSTARRASTDFAGIAARSPAATSSSDPLLLDRHRADASSAWASRPRSRRSTSGRPTSTRARRRRSPRSWRSRRRRPRSASSLRFFDVALIDAQADWGPALAALATITIVVGNVGALGQSSLKRLLAWSSVAQAGYMLAGVVVATRLGRAGDGLLPRRLPGHEPRGVRGDRRARARDGARRRHRRASPGSALARRCWRWPMTLAMLGLAGIPATAGFIGKFYLIDAAVDGDYTWLGVVIVIGSMISLAYYLRVIAAMWMQPAPAPRRAPRGAAPRPPGARRRADAAARPAARGRLVAASSGPRRRLRHRPLAAVRPAPTPGRRQRPAYARLTWGRATAPWAGRRATPSPTEDPRTRRRAAPR